VEKHCEQNSYLKWRKVPSAIHPAIAQLNRIDPETNRIDPETNRIDPEVNRIDPEINRIDPETSSTQPHSLFTMIIAQKVLR